MHVEGGRVKGLALHVERLIQDSVALFSVKINQEQIREIIKHSMAGLGDTGLLRITLFSPAFEIGRPVAKPHELVAHAIMRQLPEGTPPPPRVRTAVYDRERPEVKHVGLFGALHHRRAAQLDGFDDALLVNVNGEVTEGTTWNIGFIDNERLIWPAGPALPGVTMRLLQEAHTRCEVVNVTRSDLGQFQAAFATNSAYGVRPIGAIDSKKLDLRHPLLSTLRATYEGIQGDRVTC